MHMYMYTYTVLYMYIYIYLSLYIYTRMHTHTYFCINIRIYSKVLQHTAQLYYIVFLCPWRLRSLADLDVKVAQLRSCTGVGVCVGHTQIQET